MRRRFIERKKDEILAAALGYLKEGLSVIPINMTSKRPVDGFRWEEFQSRLMTEGEAKKNFNNNVNIGVICGKVSGNLTIIDFDEMKLYEKRWSKKGLTRTSETGKGVHLWFKSQIPVKTTHLKKSFGIPLDIQGEGAYVLAPPSHHYEKNKDYAFVGDNREIAEYEGDIVADVLDFLKESKEHKETDFEKAVDKIDIDAILPGSEEGSRDDDAIKLASWYRLGGLGEEQTALKMAKWNERNKPPLPEKDLETKIRQAFKNERPYFSYSFARLPTEEEKEQLQELTPEIEEFLRSPDILSNILKITKNFIIGEKELVLLHIFTGLCTVFVKRPFGVIISARYATGKSFIQENIANIFPKERTDQPTSMSEKVVNYLTDNFKGRIVRIDELFAMEDGMPYIRVWMTNGRLEHWVTSKDPASGQIGAKKLKVEGSPVFWTSTVTNIEEQYGSRNWLCTTNVNPEQTKRIQNYQDAMDMTPEGFNKDETAKLKLLTDSLRWLMQNAKPVLVPFRVNFPSSEPRARREKPKFKDLIKSICQFKQLQRETIIFEGKTYLITEERDFEDALKIAMPFLVSTILTLDDSAIKILEWARKEKPIGSYFSVKEAAKGAKVQMKTVWRRLDDMAERGYVKEIEEGAGRRPSTYELTEQGSAETDVGITIIDDYSHHKVKNLLKDLLKEENSKEFAGILKKIKAEDDEDSRLLYSQDTNLEAEFQKAKQKLEAKNVSREENKRSKSRGNFNPIA